jgi:hypothetical protein
MLVFLILVLAVAVAIGFLIGRWAVVAVLAAAWPLYFLGLHQEWWGHGVGDGWQVILVTGTLVAAVAGAAGVLARRRTTRPIRPA